MADAGGLCPSPGFPPLAVGDRAPPTACERAGSTHPTPSASSSTAPQPHASQSRAVCSVTVTQPGVEQAQPSFVLLRHGRHTRDGAPGVTRTPGTQFRKLLLYPPELRGPTAAARSE